MPLCTHTRTKTHTASLLAKPTPLNINLGSDRFSMFNNERDISERGGGYLIFLICFKVSPRPHSNILCSKPSL